MTSLVPNTSLGQLVADRPNLARVFDRLGLDYCCGGRTTLSQACEEKGLDVDKVVGKENSILFPRASALQASLQGATAS